MNSVNYYEDSYNSSLLGLSRYCSNFGRQCKLAPVKPIVALLMAVIEVVEFLATMQLVELVTTKQYDSMLAWTYYTYLFLFVVKFINLAWLVFTQWDSKVISTPVKVVQFLSLYLFCVFLPYGEFFVDCGYKMFCKPEDEGEQEPYPQSFEILVAKKHYKSYKGRIGGHTLLMFNGWLTTVINWILLIVVLSDFTPAVFPRQGEVAGSSYVFYYGVVVVHLVATTWLSISMVLRSCMCPNRQKKEDPVQAGYLQ